MPANPDLDTRHLPDTEAPELAPFWEGCRAEELRIPRCEACGKLVWYPQLACPRCGSERISTFTTAAFTDSTSGAIDGSAPAGPPGGSCAGAGGWAAGV